MEMDGHFTLKSMAILIDSANFAVWVYSIMAQLSWYQVCVCQGCASPRLNSCPDLNKSGQGRAEKFPQWDPESCYRFGSGPNCSNPMTWLVFLFLLCSLHLLYYSKRMSEWSEGVASKVDVLKSDNQSDKLSDCLCACISTGSLYRLFQLVIRDSWATNYNS